MSDPGRQVYVGYSENDRWTVVVRGADGRERPLKHHVRHSPDGFAWGYGGSGPAELARCILIDYFGDAARCSVCHGRGVLVVPADQAEGEHEERCYECGGERFNLPVSYQEFKWDWIAKLAPNRGFEISAADIAEWVTQQKEAA